jgi:N-alpha-acetyl-L-2,4-diaminobutyrate deacetylase
MRLTVVDPNDIDFDSPGRRDYWVALEHDSLWGFHRIPLTVIVGPKAQPGRGICATGSNHGNEYEGPVAIKQLLKAIRTEDVLGRVILIPVLNPAAFNAGTRESAGDIRGNLNRAFVDGAGETPALNTITYRIAKFVREYLFPQVHTFIDIHAGGDMVRFALGASFHPIPNAEQGRIIEETARWFGTPLLIVYQNRTPGLLPSDAENRGKIMVAGEFGHGDSVNSEGVRYATHGILAAAIHQGQLAGNIEKFGHHADGTQRKVEIVDPKCFLHAPWPGHFQCVVEPGSRVKKGQTVGLLHDFHRIDDEPHEFKSNVDGIVVAQGWKAPVKDGQCTCVVGIVTG